MKKQQGANAMRQVDILNKIDILKEPMKRDKRKSLAKINTVDKLSRNSKNRAFIEIQ